MASLPCIPLLAALGLSLGGCANAPAIPGISGEPLFYKKLDASAAKVDAATARDMISIYRRKSGQSTLTIDPALQKAAEEQALAMARADRMSHDVRGSLRSRLDGRLDHSAAVENISAGYHTLAEAFSGWRDSPSHNKNMLNPAMRRMGIATAYAPGSKYKVYWALVLTD
ncbi:MAG: hypothetical protein JWL93_1037 [Hyphomicrobiales bacterium]|jgi:uncharacterized protein YkwD|nr:hypothetical protein [Hyphomicrobiales bacterium]